MPPAEDRRSAEGTLQHIVDLLAVRLARSVALDDRHLRLLAASRHFGDEDAVRLQSLLDRELRPANLDHVLSLGVADWTGPGVVEATQAFGSSRRICLPVRHLGQHFGYLWLIDAQSTLSDEDLVAAERAASDAAMVLRGEVLQLETRDGHDGALVRDLVSSEPSVRSRACQEVRQDRLLADPRHSAVLVVEVDGADVLAAEEVRDALRRAADGLVQAWPSRSLLQLVEGSRLVVVATAAAPWGSGVLATHAASVCRHVERALLVRQGGHAPGDGQQVRVRAGIGSGNSGLEDASSSYDQARQAVRAGRVLGLEAAVTEWDELGVYGVLLKLTSADLSPANYPAALVRLVRADPEGRLVATLETYLDEAGDAVRSAARLGLHRTTLHYRLRKVEQYAGVSLANGEARLTLHLGIKLARLGGALPAPS